MEVRTQERTHSHTCVTQRLSSSDSRFWIDLKESYQQVSSRIRLYTRHVNRGCVDASLHVWLIEYSRRLIPEGMLSSEENIGENSQGPHVALCRVFNTPRAGLTEQFGCQVETRAGFAGAGTPTVVRVQFRCPSSHATTDTG